MATNKEGFDICLILTTIASTRFSGNCACIAVVKVFIGLCPGTPLVNTCSVLMLHYHYVITWLTSFSLADAANYWPTLELLSVNYHLD